VLAPSNPSPTILHDSTKAFSIPSSWSFPPPGFIKLNFDGASKGNPGPVGFGAVLRDWTRQITYILVGHLGHDTNNSTELWGLLKGIQLAINLNINNLIIEGDSKVIPINGIAKISPSWRLLSLLETFRSLLKPSLTLLPSHVRQDANKVADKLANEGVNSQSKDILIVNHQHPTSQMMLH
jgi:ribonuclease HI